MIIVTGHIQVPPSDAIDFINDLRVLAVASRRREGCLTYNAALEDPEAGRVLVVERWRDDEALKAHLRADDTSHFIQRWEKRLRGDVLKYDADNGRSLAD